MRYRHSVWVFHPILRSVTVRPESNDSRHTCCISSRVPVWSWAKSVKTDCQFSFRSIQFHRRWAVGRWSSIWLFDVDLKSERSAPWFEMISSFSISSTSILVAVTRSMPAALLTKVETIFRPWFSTFLKITILDVKIPRLKIIEENSYQPIGSGVCWDLNAVLNAKSRYYIVDKTQIDTFVEFSKVEVIRFRSVKQKNATVQYAIPSAPHRYKTLYI